MITLELKTYPSKTQKILIEEAIRSFQFVRNKALRKWIDSYDKNTHKHSENSKTLYKLSKTLSNEFEFVKPLNSTARQAATERAWNSILRFYKGLSKYPKFQKYNRSVEFKQSGWKLSPDNKRISISSFNIGSLRLKGSHNLQDYAESKIYRVRILRRADGYYIQFCVDATRKLPHNPTGKAVGIDVGLEKFLTDSDGKTIENPRFLRKAETILKRLQRRHSKCSKKSNNRTKARIRLSRKHLKISRQRKDFVTKVARQIITDSDFVAIEDLTVDKMVRDHKKVAKSFNDAGLSMFRQWLEYFGSISNVPVIAVPPEYTSQECSSCGKMVQKSLSERTHSCSCGCILDRDLNAAKNILSRAFGLIASENTVGHTGINASGESVSLVVNNHKQFSLKEESTGF